MVRFGPGDDQGAGGQLIQVAEWAVGSGCQGDVSGQDCVTGGAGVARAAQVRYLLRKRGDVPGATDYIGLHQVGIDADLVETDIVGGTWDVTSFTQEIAHLRGTSYPGTPGNAVLAGHITLASGANGPFRYLDQLTPGSLIIARAESHHYIYIVESVEIVPEDALEVTYISDEPTMTLVTCAGWDNANWRYSQRLIVRARMVSVVTLGAEDGGLDT